MPGSEFACLINSDGFRQMLRAAFPPVPFGGLVTIHKCDEGRELLSELPGKTWTEVPSSFIAENSLSLPLLEPDALVAFLPAWLIHAVEKLDQDNQVLEFTLYFLAPNLDVA